MCCLTSTAVAHDIVHINKEQKISENDLLAGSFLGQVFTLEPTTQFEVNEGGQFDAVGDSRSVPVSAFDFGGATVNVNDGGAFATRTRLTSVIANVSLNVFHGASVGRFVNGSGSTTNVTGGTIVGATADSDSELTIADGVFAQGLIANPDSSVNVSGGHFGPGVQSHPGSHVSFFGGEFQLNGVAFDGPKITLDSTSGTDVFTGTFENGAPFIFSSQAGDVLSEVNLIRTPLPAIDLTPMEVVSDAGLQVRGLRKGQSIILKEGGMLGNNLAVVEGVTLEVQGGYIGRGLEILEADLLFSGGTLIEGDAYSGSTINISGGTVYGVNAFAGSTITVTEGDVRSIRACEGSTVDISSGTIQQLTADSGAVLNVTDGILDDVILANNSTMNVSGGSFGSGFRVRNGAIANISDGVFDGAFSTADGAIANIFGGDIGDSARISRNSTLNVYGGNIGSNFRAFLDSTVNLYVTSLLINGEVVDLAPGVPFEVTTRDGTLLEAILADGSHVDFTLNGIYHPTEDIFVSGATLNAILVPEPNSLVLMYLSGVSIFLTKRRCLAKSH